MSDALKDSMDDTDEFLSVLPTSFVQKLVDMFAKDGENFVDEEFMILVNFFNSAMMNLAMAIGIFNREIKYTITNGEVRMPPAEVVVALKKHGRKLAKLIDFLCERDGENPDCSPDRKPTETTGDDAALDRHDGGENAVDRDNSAGTNAGAFVKIEKSNAYGDSPTSQPVNNLGANQAESAEGPDCIMDRKPPEVAQ